MIQNNEAYIGDSKWNESPNNKNDEINRFCGLDIHKSSITACIKGKFLQEEIKTFGTSTADLKKLRDWLYENEINHLAMESTGSYWKPVFNILDEDNKIKLMLVNAKQLKYVPGRKSDVRDSQWLCNLLQLGLLKGSFVPPEAIRNLRDLTRYEVKLQHQLTGHKNRIHKIMHECNIKLCDVLTDIFGKTGFKILKDLSEGITNPNELSKYFLHFPALKKKYEKAKIALEGKVSDHHQFMLKSILNQIEITITEIKEVNTRIENQVKEKFSKEQDLLKTIPGIDKKTSQTIIAELGVDMNVFPSENHASSWAGTCPKRNKSAENIKNSKNEGNKHLKSALNQSSWSTIKCKDSFLKGKYYYLAGKIGDKRALCAIANKLLKSAYQVLLSGKEYIEKGHNDLKNNNKINLVKNYINDLNKEGYKATFEIS